jgi:putative ABC transport system ATP-binding protein
MKMIKNAESSVELDNDKTEYQIKITNLEKTYKTGDIITKALNGINLKVQKGAFRMILGPSGCGKTTLLNILGGLDTPEKGEVLINFNDGFKNILNFSRNELTQYRRKRIGIIFQFYNLIPILTALENVELAARFSGIPEPVKRSKELLEEFGLANKFNRYPNQLSGGEQQRVAIARALVKNPLLILADEPTGNLDTVKSNEIYNQLKRLSTEFGKTVLIVTHDEDMADKFASDHIHIRDGKIYVSEEEAHNIGFDLKNKN